MEPIEIIALLWPLPFELGERTYTVIIFVVFTIAVGFGISVFLLVAGAIVRLMEDEMSSIPTSNRTGRRYRIRG